jgi:hypothetical protein
MRRIGGPRSLQSSRVTAHTRRQLLRAGGAFVPEECAREGVLAKFPFENAPSRLLDLSRRREELGDSKMKKSPSGHPERAQHESLIIQVTDITALDTRSGILFLQIQETNQLVHYYRHRRFIYS